MKLKLLRGNHTKVSQYLGAEGEIIFNTDSNEIHIMDGVSQGGHSFSLNTAGIIAACAMPTPPSGWFACDGSAVSRTVYANLFSAIGELWGAGDGSTTFNLPDLRGEFLRGWSNSSGNDPDETSRTGGDTVGSSQGHALPALFGSWSNNHGQNRISVYNSTGLSGTTAIVGQGTSSWRQTIENVSGSYARVDLDSTRVIPNGSDVRPRNKYVQYCIRY